MPDPSDDLAAALETIKRVEVVYARLADVSCNYKLNSGLRTGYSDAAAALRLALDGTDPARGSA